MGPRYCALNGERQTVGPAPFFYSLVVSEAILIAPGARHHAASTGVFPSKVGKYHKAIRVVHENGHYHVAWPCLEARACPCGYPLPFHSTREQVCAHCTSGEIK